MFNNRIGDHRMSFVAKASFFPQVFHEVLPGPAVGDEIDINRSVPLVVAVHRPASDENGERIPLILVTGLHPLEYRNQLVP